MANTQTILDAIKGSTCETADAAAEAALETLRAFDLEYDRQIGHGATQDTGFHRLRLKRGEAAVLMSN